MIGLDTNVLVRYLAQDDARQAPRATALMDSLTAERPGYVALVALVELVWVMKNCYAATRQDIFDVVDRLARTQEIRLENNETVIKALRLFSESKADFADCLIEQSAAVAGCEFTVSFDSDAVKRAGMRMID